MTIGGHAIRLSFSFVKLKEQKRLNAVVWWHRSAITSKLPEETSLKLIVSVFTVSLLYIATIFGFHFLK